MIFTKSKYLRALVRTLATNPEVCPVEFAFKIPSVYDVASINPILVEILEA